MEPSAGAARGAMGCCQGKDFQTSGEQAKEAGSQEVQEGGTGDTQGCPGSRECGMDHPEVGLGRIELSGLASSQAKKGSMQTRRKTGISGRTEGF